MKVKKIFFIFTLIFGGLLTVLIHPQHYAHAVTDGDLCTQINISADCPCAGLSVDNPATCCCTCNGHNWIKVLNSPCQALHGADEPASEQIRNPVLKKFGFGEGADIIAQLIANALKIAFSVSGLILLAMLISGGIQWMLGGGDKEAVGKAQKRITNALVGFIILMSVFAIINYLLPALGIELNILRIEWPTP